MNSMSDNGIVKGKWTEFIKNYDKIHSLWQQTILKNTALPAI